MSSTALELPGWYIEFQAALLRQAPRPGQIDQFVAEGWVNNQKSLKKNLASCLLPIPVATRTESPNLLELVGTVRIPATTGKFVARKKFVINTERNEQVNISYIGGNFKEWFLKGDGKIEEPIIGQTLRYSKLCKESVDSPIIDELGGEAKAETSLLEMFFFMEKQEHIEDGVPLNDIKVKIFYIKDSAGVLRTVGLYWSGDGWDVRASSVGDPRRWSDGRHVFSREPSETLVSAQV